MANPYPAQFTDDNSRIRIDGKINFTDAANQPGSGFVPARNVGQASYGFSEDLTAAEQKHLTLTRDGGDTTLADLTDPTNPKIVTPGIYAFTLAVNLSVLGVAGGWLAGLLVDDNYYSLTVRSSRLGSDDDGFNLMPVCVVWWCDAADPFAVLAGVGAGAGTDHFTGELYVQRIV